MQKFRGSYRISLQMTLLVRHTWSLYEAIMTKNELKISEFLVKKNVPSGIQAGHSQ